MSNIRTFKTYSLFLNICLDSCVLYSIFQASSKSVLQQSGLGFIDMYAFLMTTFLSVNVDQDSCSARTTNVS